VKQYDYWLCIAKRRSARADVKLWTDGTGKATVNDLLLVEYFPQLQDRYVLFVDHSDEWIQVCLRHSVTFWQLR